MQKDRIRKYMSTLWMIAYREEVKKPEKAYLELALRKPLLLLRENRELCPEEISKLEYWLHVLATLIDMTGKPFTRMQQDIEELREGLQHEQNTAGRD